MCKCDRCGKEEKALMPYMDENLCWHCWKKQDLKDQRDGEESEDYYDEDEPM